MKLEKIKLSKEIPEIEFKLNSVNSYILLHSVAVTSPKNFKNEWTNFISQVKLTAVLKYVVFDDSQQHFIDEREIQYPINLLVDQNHVQPNFQLDRLIKNETLSMGVNANLKYYCKLKLKLQEVENLQSEYSLDFLIEKYKIDN
jgi:hypothetical protein